MERLPFKVVFVSDWQIKVQHSLSCQLCWVSTNSWGKTSDPLAARWQLCSPASCQCRLSVAWCWAGSVCVIKPIHLKTCRAERNWRVWETIICGIVTTSRAFWTLPIMIRPIVWMKILILILQLNATNGIKKIEINPHKATTSYHIWHYINGSEGKCPLISGVYPLH